MSHVLCKQRVVWDRTQLGGWGKGIRASTKGGQEGSTIRRQGCVLEPKERL